MKNFLKTFALAAIVAGAYLVTTSVQPRDDGGEDNLVTQVELVSSVVAQSKGHECYTKCNQPCYRCEKSCSTQQCRSDCYARADACARTYGFSGHAHGGNSCNNACL